MDTTDRSEVDIDLCAALAAHAKVREIHLSGYDGGESSIILKMDLPTGEYFERHYRRRKPLIGPTPLYWGEEAKQAFPIGGVNEIRPVAYGRMWTRMSCLNKEWGPRTKEDILNSAMATRAEEELSVEGVRAFHYEPATARYQG